MILLAVLLLMQSAHAGKLRDFEKKATEKKASSSTSSNGDDGHQRRSSYGSGTYPSRWGRYEDSPGFLAWLITAPFRYRYNDPAGYDEDFEGEEWASEDRYIPWAHAAGEPTVPHARLDYNWQYVDSNINAQDVRVELGWKWLAFHGRTTMYEDASDGFRLDLNQFYGVLRLDGASPETLPGKFEFGLGFGGVQLKGDESNSSGAIMLPVKYYPVDWCGLEFRAAWYEPVNKTISDYDLSISLGLRYVQLRGGYRWLWLEGEGEFNTGPYAGLSLFF